MNRINKFFFTGVALAGTVGAGKSQTNPFSMSPTTGSPNVVQRSILKDQRPAPPQSALRDTSQVSDHFSPPVASTISRNDKHTPPAGSTIGVSGSERESSHAAIMLSQGQEIQAKGDFLKAQSLYDSAEAEARRQGDRETAGIAALSSARAIQLRNAGKSPEAEQRLVIEKYKRAVSDAPPAQQALARNNLGTLYMQGKNYGEAARVLRGINWAAVDPAQAYLCRYNLGRAEELSGNPGKAIEQYTVAIREKPKFAPAVDGAFRILAQETNVDPLLNLAEGLIDQGEGSTVRHEVLLTLAKTSSRSDAYRLLVPLVHAYCAERVTPLQFEKDDRQPLERLAESAEGLRSYIGGINRTFAGEVKSILSSSYAREIFPDWSRTEQQQEALSRLLQNVGNFYSGAHDEAKGTELSRALGCYVTAWMLYEANTDAAIGAATLLNEHPQLDSKGSMLREIGDKLIESKGRAYAIPIKTRHDWLNLLRLHLVLASIYEKQQLWGSEQRVDSVIFQLSRAVSIEELLRRDDPSFTPSPDVYARLGRAYAVAERRTDACTQLLKAAEGYSYFHQSSHTAEALKQIDALGLTLNNDQLARIEKIKVEL